MQRNKKKVFLLIAIPVVFIYAFMFVSCVSCVNRVKNFSCSGYRNPDKIEMKKYLNKRYDRKMELLSYETYVEEQYKYLDSKMAKPPEKEDSIPVDDIDVYTFKDEDNIEFHFTHYLQPGFVGHYKMQDDYCVQWLLDKEDKYRMLMDSGFNCEYFNEIGYENNPEAGFRLYINSLEELGPAVKLAYDTVDEANVVLPDTQGNDEDRDIDASAIHPVVYIYSSMGYRINVPVEFCTKKEKYSVAQEKYYEDAAYNYTDLVREGTIDEELPDDILNKYGPEEITDVKYNEKDLELEFARNDDGEIKNKDRNTYYMHDWIYDIDESSLYFNNIAVIAGCAGYDVVNDEDFESFILKKDNDEVVIKLKEDKLKINKNGDSVKLEGNAYIQYRHAVLELTVNDIYTLFGIRADIDMVKGSVEIN